VRVAKVLQEKSAEAIYRFAHTKPQNTVKNVKDHNPNTLAKEAVLRLQGWRGALGGCGEEIRGRPWAVHR